MSIFTKWLMRLAGKALRWREPDVFCSAGHASGGTERNMSLLPMSLRTDVPRRSLKTADSPCLVSMPPRISSLHLQWKIRQRAGNGPIGEKRDDHFQCR